VAEIKGIVRSAEGEPIEGVLVMGADLNYAETDRSGRFQLRRPEMALFFYCTGYLPRARVLRAGEECIEVYLRSLGVVRASV